MDPTEALEITDIEGYLQHHQDLIVLTAIDSSRNTAEENVQFLQKNWMNSNWSAARKYLSENLARLSNKSNIFKGPTSQVNDSNTAPNNSSLEISQSFDSNFKSSSNFQTPKYRDLKHPKFDNSTTDSLSCFVEIISNISDGQLNIKNNFRPIVNMRDILKKVDPKDLGMSVHLFREFGTSLELIATMVGEFHDLNSKGPGYYSPICFSRVCRPEVSLVKDRSMNLLNQSRIFYENQFSQYMDKVIDKAIVDGRARENMGAGSAKGIRTKIFIDILSANNQFELGYDPVLMPNGIPFWPFIYYSIRVGDIQSAHDELIYIISKAVNSFDRETYQIVSEFLEYLLHGNRKLRVQSLQNLDEICSKAARILSDYNEDNMDYYLLQVINLLRLWNPDESYKTHKSIEDFLWTNLWFITWSDELKRFGANPNIIGDFNLDGFSGVIDECCSNDRLDPEGTDPFKYAIVLFSCQRFGEAIYYLWEHKQMIPAVHLLSCCIYYGLILPFEELAPNSSKIRPQDLLMYWLEEIRKIFDVTKCSKYLLLLDSNWKIHELMSIVDRKILEKYQTLSQDVIDTTLISLIDSCSLEDIKLLLGDINRVGLREKGSLDLHFSTNQVEQIIRFLATKTYENDRNDPMNLYYQKFLGSTKQKF